MEDTEQAVMDDGEEATEDVIRLTGTKPDLMALASQLPADSSRPADRRRSRNPDYYLSVAKQAVVRNYNGRNINGRELNLSDVRIASASKLKQGWQVVAESSVLRDMLWKVSYDVATDTTAIEVYKRVDKQQDQGAQA